jgi:hypothetical protein
MPRSLLCSLCLASLCAVPARANPPQLTGINPAGVQRGVAAELTVSGANLTGNPQLVAPFELAVEPPATPAADASSWKLKVTVPPSVPLGVYPIRVKTDDGISAPLLFRIGQFPQVAEAEPNNTFEAAQVLPALPVIVEGQASGTDVDYFQFAGKKGQRLVIDAQCARIGSGVDPQVRLTTASHAYIASADDTPGLMTDARLTAVLPDDGEYVVELSDSKYQGAGRAVYRLELGPVPVVEEVFPLGGRRGETVGLELRGGITEAMRPAAATLAAPAGVPCFRPAITTAAAGLSGPGEPAAEVELPRPLVVGDLPEVREPADPAAPPLRTTFPVVINGRIDPPGDEDRFVLAVTPGQSLRIQVDAAELGSSLDGSLQVLKPDGSALATGDDTPAPNVPTRFQPRAAGIISADPSLTFAVPAGLTEITLALKDLEGRGGVGFPYRLTVEPVEPTFDLSLSEAQVSVPRGGASTVSVAVARQGYNGPIVVSVADPPAGLSVRAGTIAEGQAVGAFSVQAAPDAAFGPVDLKVIGTGQGPSGPIVVPALKLVVYAQQGNVPITTGLQRTLAAAPAQPEAIAFEAPAEPVELVHGLGGAIPLKLIRKEGADAGLTVTALPLPPGLALPETKIAEKATEAVANINVAREAALGSMTIGLTAKGKFGDAERTFSIPAVTLNVVRPAALELAATSVEVKAGTAVELKGKVVRKGAFKEPVTVQLKGLPGGVKSEAVTVAPDAAELSLKIEAEPGAAEAMASAQAALAFKVGDKDYPVPPVPLGVKVTK